MGGDTYDIKHNLKPWEKMEVQKIYIIINLGLAF